MKIFGNILGKEAQIGQQKEAAPVKLETTPTTLEILREITSTPQPSKEHTDKLHKLLDQESRCFTSTERKRLKALGFRIFLTSDWIGRFIYHANIFTPHSVHEAVHVRYDESGEDDWLIGDAVNYTGDIPGEVIDKAISVKPLVSQITIHSMMPFPVEFVHCDPIMIGWAYSPRIQLFKNGKFEKVWHDNAEGVVIAIWDYEKEVNLAGSLF